MLGLGFTELIVILVIVLIIFGAGRLPELGDGIGRGIRNFRKAIKSLAGVRQFDPAAATEVRHG